MPINVFAKQLKVICSFLAQKKSIFLSQTHLQFKMFKCVIFTAWFFVGFINGADETGFCLCNPFKDHIQTHICNTGFGECWKSHYYSLLVFKRKYHIY
jgi:hypothetical protein